MANKSETPTLDKLGIPRPKKYREGTFRESMIEQVKKLCALGATEREVADFLGVTLPTFWKWRMRHPQLDKAYHLNRMIADERVIQRLYARAMGYEHDEMDIRSCGNKIVQTPVRRYYPPDTRAIEYWLRNRNPGGQWSQSYNTSWNREETSVLVVPNDAPEDQWEKAAEQHRENLAAQANRLDGEE